VSGAGREQLAGRGFDAPARFASYLHGLCWQTVTATDATLFQAPFRAGIRLTRTLAAGQAQAKRLPQASQADPHDQSEEVN
jgi:hypothetical protein